MPPTRWARPPCTGDRAVSTVPTIFPTTHTHQPFPHPITRPSHPLSPSTSKPTHAQFDTHCTLAPAQPPPALTSSRQQKSPQPKLREQTPHL